METETETLAQAILEARELLDKGANRPGDDNGDSRMLLAGLREFIVVACDINCECGKAKCGDCYGRELLSEIDRCIDGYIRPIENRVSSIPGERAMFGAWETFNEEGSDRIRWVREILNNDTPSQRDIDCVTATMQWLGSPAGQTFVETAFAEADSLTAINREMELDGIWWSRLQEFENQHEERKIEWVEKVCEQAIHNQASQINARQKHTLAKTMASLILQFTNGEFQMPAQPTGGDDRHITLGDDE